MQGQILNDANPKILKSKWHIFQPFGVTLVIVAAAVAEENFISIYYIN